MADVYGHAYFTLAALSALDYNGGLFMKRDSQWVMPCILTWPSDAGVSEGLIVHPALGDDIVQL